MSGGPGGGADDHMITGKQSRTSERARRFKQLQSVLADVGLNERRVVSVDGSSETCDAASPRLLLLLLFVCTAALTWTFLSDQ